MPAGRAPDPWSCIGGVAQQVTAAGVVWVCFVVVMMDNVCRNCRYWSLVFGETRFGECRRHAPYPVTQLMPEAGDLETFWASFPVTPDGAWCGEFEAQQGAD